MWIFIFQRERVGEEKDGQMAFCSTQSSIPERQHVAIEMRECHGYEVTQVTLEVASHLFASTEFCGFIICLLLLLLLDWPCKKFLEGQFLLFVSKL